MIHRTRSSILIDYLLAVLRHSLLLVWFVVESTRISFFVPDADTYNMLHYSYLFGYDSHQNNSNKAIIQIVHIILYHIFSYR